MEPPVQPDPERLASQPSPSELEEPTSRAALWIIGACVLFLIVIGAIFVANRTAPEPTPAADIVSATLERGTAGGAEWVATARRIGEGESCVHLSISPPEGESLENGACWAPEPREYMGPYALAGAVSERQFVIGVMGADVATLRFEPEDGDPVTVETYRPDDFPVSFFVVQLPMEVQIARIVGLDERGTILGRQQCRKYGLSSGPLPASGCVVEDA